jgi:hypothetical protein
MDITIGLHLHSYVTQKMSPEVLGDINRPILVEGRKFVMHCSELKYCTTDSCTSTPLSNALDDSNGILIKIRA